VRATVNFREYLFKKRITQIEFAKRLGISRGHLGQILHGTKHPSRKLAKKIEEETEGKVTAVELLFPEQSAKEEDI
jgi:transcriptional regulator with XRE-family HTH domain